LDSILVCYYACIALFDIIEKASKEIIRQLISLGGATAVAKLREEWPDDNDIQTLVRSLAKLIGLEIKSWADMQVETPVAAEKVTTASSSSTAVSNTASAAVANTASAAAKHGDSIDCIGALVQDLFPFGNAKVNASLDALNLDLLGHKSKCDKIQVVGGCLALVLLLKKCLDKAIDERVMWEPITELNELAELTTLHKTLHIMIRLSYHLDESKVGIVAIGGVEAVIKAMKTFPKCLALQHFACMLLLNLACCSTGKKRIVKADGIDYLLAAINNHLNSVLVCKYSCITLSNIIEKENKEGIRLLINLGGATAVAKVRDEWPDGGAV
jgi:hypothetical protein